MELQVFDYLIAGAGAAGCVLAARLAEDPKVSVGLIEAGPALPSAWSLVPALRSASDTASLRSQPQSGLGGRTVDLRWGQGLGGSSNIGDGLWQPAPWQDFASWQAADPQLWSPRSLWAGRQRAEAAPGEAGEISELRGTKGRFALSRAGQFDPLTQSVFRAGHRAGLAVTEDLSQVSGPAMGRSDSPVAAGRRVTARSAYLQPLPPNVTLIDQARVRRLQFLDRRAVGLEVERGQGWLTSFQARREVILALGALATPQVLMASGLGPGALLRRYDLPVFADLPGLGQGLTDAPSLTLTFGLKDPSLSLGADLRWDRAAWQALLYLSRRQGAAAASLWSASAQLSSSADPGLRLDFAPLALEPSDEATPRWSDRARLGRWLAGAGLRASPGLSLRLTLTQPQSRGSITPAVDDPSAAARLDPGYLRDPRDVEALAAGLQSARSILDQAPLEGLLVEPEAAFDAAASLTWMQETLQPGQAYRGTCRMGQEGENGAVLDGSLRPFGTQNLRVVDASVLPAEVSAPPLASVVMLAERAAALVRQEWRGV